MWAINLINYNMSTSSVIVHHLHRSSYTCRRRCVPPTSSTRAPVAVVAASTQFTFAPWLIACSNGALAPPLASVDHGSEAGRTAVQSQSSTRLSLAPDASRRPVPSARNDLWRRRQQGPSAQAVCSAHPGSRALPASQEGAPPVPRHAPPPRHIRPHQSRRAAHGRPRALPGAGPHTQLAALPCPPCSRPSSARRPPAAAASSCAPAGPPPGACPFARAGPRSSRAPCDLPACMACGHP
jgi:hypothetical protein